MFSFSHTWKNKSMIKHFFSWQNKIAGGKQITSRKKIHIVVDLWKNKPDSLRLDWAVSRFSQTISWCHYRRTTYKKNFSNSLLQIQFRSPATEKHWAKQNQSRSTRRWALETETWRRLQQQLDTLTSRLRVGLQLLWGLQLPQSRHHLVWEGHRRKVNVYEETVSRCFYLVQLISHINKDTTHMKAETWFFIIWTKTEQHLIKHKIILLQNVYRTFIVDLLYS